MNEVIVRLLGRGVFYENFGKDLFCEFFEVYSFYFFLIRKLIGLIFGGLDVIIFNLMKDGDRYGKFRDKRIFSRYKIVGGGVGVGIVKRLVIYRIVNRII